MAKLAVLILLSFLLAGCAQSAEEQIAKKQEEIARLRFELRDMDAEMLKSKLARQIDATLLDPETRRAMAAADREAESAERVANAEIRRDINAAIARLEGEISDLRRNRP